jgi:hypothetical protein
LASSREAKRFVDSRRRGVQVEPAAVGGDRLQPGEASLPRGGDLAGETCRAQLLHDTLDPHDRGRLAARELAELVPARAGAGRRIAVVDEQPLGAGGAKERTRVLGRIGREPSLVDGLLVRLAAEVLGQQRDRAPVG